MTTQKFWTTIFPFIITSLLFIGVAVSIVIVANDRSNKDKLATANIQMRGPVEVLETFYLHFNAGQFVAICRFDDGGRVRIVSKDGANPLPGDRWSVEQMGDFIYFSELISERRR